jgi:hypothetical protein
MVLQLCLFACAATVLLLLPGFSLLRVCAPRLDLVSRIVLAPGVTIAVVALLFLWAEVFSVKLGWPVPWIVLVLSLLALVQRRPDLSLLHGDWLGCVVLDALLVVLLVVRFYSTRDWIVPPGVDSAQHTIIVQLLLDHHGLFQSWAPYSDAETFTYHFGFHAVTALFVWLTGADASFAVLIMARVIGACALLSIFGLVRLWTRSVWGGVFAIALWETYAQHLYFYDIPGRWLLLAGFTVLSSALVLLASVLSQLDRKTSWPLLLLCALTIAGLVLTQYKTGLIFAILAAVFVGNECLREIISRDPAHAKHFLRILVRASVVVALALLLSAPKLNAVLHAKAGKNLQRIVLEAPAPNPNAFGAPVLDHAGILRTGFNTPQKIIPSCLALLGAITVLLRRRDAIWYLAGWVLVTLAMNPRLVGMNRTGVIDEIYWKFAVQTAIAAMGGFAIGFICETFWERRSKSAEIALAFAALVLSLWSAASSPALPQSAHFVLPGDLRLMSWMEDHVPPNEKIAARSFFDDRHVQGHDAAIWLPYFARHQTNQTSLAADLEFAPGREKTRKFTRELYARDMSTPESARWMRESGFPWFFVGAIRPEIDTQLVQQIARNPAIELVRKENAALLYRVR